MSDDSVADLLERVMSRVPEPATREVQKPAARVTRPRDAFDAADPKFRLQGILGQTHIATNFGSVPAHLIRVGDRVRTRTGRYLPVEDIQEYKLDMEYIERHSEALPTLIPRGALDGRYPTQDVMLSPEQLVTLDGKHARPEFVHARELQRSRQAVDLTLGLVAYYKFQFAEPTEVFCDGIWVRSI